MINWFLRAKHWQLFLLIFGVMIVAYVTIMYFVFSDIMSLTAGGQQPDPRVMFRYMKLLPFFVVFVMLVSVGWHWSVGIGLQEKFPPGVTMKTTLFKVFLIVPVVYITVLLFLMGMLFKQFFEFTPWNELHDSVGFSIMSFFSIIFPLHLFTVFCHFYNMYFVARTIKTAELRRATTFSDFIGEFFLIWFFPIGIWILQPKINALHENAPGAPFGATDPTVLDETIRN